MSTMIDTLSYHRDLRRAGFNEAQADAVAHGFKAAEERSRDNLVTNDHLDVKVAQLDTRFAQFDTRFAQIDTRFAQIETKIAEASGVLRSDIRDTKSTMIMWAIGSQIVLVGALAALAQFTTVFHR
jgi:hypothetical protein